MDSPQSIVSPFKNSMVAERERQKSDFFSKASEVNRKNTVSNMENFIGVLEVYVHQARDIHNICIYHKQDVYAKLCLTSDPEISVSTKTINGGGQNPVFNENLSLNVRTVDTSLKCEIFMMSRVRNYLEDQLLGFALVPLSEVLLKNGKLDKEFSLSSTDLFHSPAGFVRLSLAYTGSMPDVMAIPTIPLKTLAADEVKDTEITESLSSELDKIEFPDPQIVNENQMMVSEYIEISCTNINLESESSEGLIASESDNQVGSEGGTPVMGSFSTAMTNSIQAPKVDSPPSSVSTNGVSSPSAAASSESSDTPVASKTSTPKHVPPTNEKNKDVGNGESDSSRAVSDTVAKPVVSVNIEPEDKVVQQEIADMYLKSMQQFTESLAKMKLPNFDTESTNSGNSSSDQSLQAPKTPGSRVFYGSRAFF